MPFPEVCLHLMRRAQCTGFRRRQSWSRNIFIQRRTHPVMLIGISIMALPHGIVYTGLIFKPVGSHMARTGRFGSSRYCHCLRLFTVPPCFGYGSGWCGGGCFGWLPHPKNTSFRLGRNVRVIAAARGGSAPDFRLSLRRGSSFRRWPRWHLRTNQYLQRETVWA